MSNVSAEHAGRSSGAVERSRARTALWAAVGISILISLVSYFDFNEIVANLEAVDGAFIGAACAILGAQYALASLRWWTILRHLEPPVGTRQALATFGLAALANLVLVTSIAGMSVRAFLLMHLGVGAAAAAAALVVERMAAVVGLLLCAAIGMAFAYSLLAPLLQQIEASRAAALVVLGGVLLTGLGAIVIRRFDWMRRLALQVRDMFWPTGAMVALIGLSLSIVVAGFVSVAVLAEGMNIAIDLFTLLAVLPFVAFVSALPISIGGWGVREGSMVAGLGLLGVVPEEAIALSIVYGLTGLLVAATLGALTSFLWFSGTKVLARETLAPRGGLTFAAVALDASPRNAAFRRVGGERGNVSTDFAV